MIDLIIPANKNIFRFTTDIQSAVEYFCINVLNLTYDDCLFYKPEWHLNKEAKKYAKYSVVIVKVRITKKHYKFELGSHIQEELG